MEQNQPPFDMIRILVIDDQPVGLRVDAPPGVENPWMPVHYSRFFDFRWLATAEECRTYRDLTWALSECNLPLLAESGWIPEIVAIDYRLQVDIRPVAERMEHDARSLDAISPLPRLWEAARSARLPPHVVSTGEIDDVVFGLKRDSDDSWGCVAGGLILSTISDHPCAPVATTRYLSDNLKREQPDTWFFEWLMASQTGGMLKGRGVTVARWQSIIEQGTHDLQERISQLAKFGLIMLSLDELSTLASGGDQPVLTFQSRYGTRRLPTAGLFINDLSGATSWARKLLEELVNPGRWADFEIAEKRADELLKTYDDEHSVWKRIKLSTLLLWKEKGAMFDESELKSLEKEFDAEIEEGTDKKGRLRIRGAIRRHVCDIRYLQLTDWVRKCTAFIVVLKLLKRFCDNWRNGMPYEEISPGEVYLALCPLARNPIILPFSDRSGRNTQADMPLNIGFTVEDVLEGRGLDAADRILFKHLAATLGIGSEYLKRYPKAKQIVEGI